MLSKPFFNSIMGSSNHSNLLYVYFCFAYYLLLTPFRFQKVSEGKYAIYGWLPQKVLCGIANSLTILKLATSFRNSVESIKPNDPVSFFILFCEACSFLFKTTIFRGFWTKSEKYLKLINFTAGHHFYLYKPKKINSFAFISIICSAYAILSLLRFVLGSGFLEFKNLSLIWWYRRIVGEAHYTFFISNSTDIHSAPELHAITTTDKCLAIVQAFIMQFRYIAGFYADLLIVVNVLTLWSPASAFADVIYSHVQSLKLERKTQQSFPLGVKTSTVTTIELYSIQKRFAALKSLSILISEAVGDTILLYYGEVLFYYGIFFDDLVLTPDLVSIFFFSTCCTLVLSANIVRRMRWLRTWLCEQDRVSLIGQNQLSMILYDLANHSVGVSASGIFTINFQFVGTMMSVVITYFIIRLQTLA